MFPADVFLHFADTQRGVPTLYRGHNEEMDEPEPVCDSPFVEGRLLLQLIRTGQQLSRPTSPRRRPPAARQAETPDPGTVSILASARTAAGGLAVTWQRPRAKTGEVDDLTGETAVVLWRVGSPVACRPAHPPACVRVPSELMV